MPLPKPKNDEDKEEFLGRCMVDETMLEEYPDEKQRYAVCLSLWEDKEENAVSKQLERRVVAVTFKVEKREDEQKKIVGHAAMFNVITDLYWFKEVVRPGAFKDSIKVDDIRALFNHNPDYVLGRNKSGTLRLWEDEKGLAIEIDPPDTQWARDLIVSMQRGDISQMSYAFEPVDTSWELENGEEIRVIKKVKLWDVSVVTYPAESSTDASIRSLRSILEAHKAGQKQAQGSDDIADKGDKRTRVAVLRKKLELKAK